MGGADLTGILKAVLSGLLETLVPSKCHFCGQLINQSDQSDQDIPGLCPACLATIERLEEPYCLICGQPFTSRRGENRICQKCFDRPPAYTAARYVGAHWGGLAEAVVKLKYFNGLDLTDCLSALLDDALDKSDLPSSYDLIIPIPLHQKRLRDRGYNQAFQLCRRLAHRGSVRSDLLRRIAPTKPQVGLSAAQRAANVKGAFSVTDNGRIDGQNILLIDDVHTSGATLGECAGCLKKAGAGGIWAMTLTRAMGN